jgi:glycosyltransferase involved in cell wall biosynthesis
MRISVTIPTLGKETLWATLRSLERQTVKPHEVIVVNQGPPGLREKLDFDLPVKVIDRDEKGLSRARNTAFQMFEGDWIMSLDDDEEANAEWVEQLTVVAQAFPEANFVGGPCLPPVRHDPAKGFVSCMYVHGDVVIDRESYMRPTGMSDSFNDIWGGNFAFSRKLVETVGAYDIYLGRGSGGVDVGEDTDYMVRTISHGFTGVSTARMIIYHTYGVRPNSPALLKDTVEGNAVTIWKSLQPGTKIDPDIASRFFPYGRKKAVLSKLSGSKLFSDQAERKAIFENCLARLNREFRLENDLMVRKDSAGA